LSRLWALVSCRRKFIGDLFRWLDRAGAENRHLVIAAELREEQVNYRHVEKRHRQQENRYPAAQAAQPH
jgi:hypothetical protein